MTELALAFIFGRDLWSRFYRGDCVKIWEMTRNKMRNKT